ncbi:hypothetical protein, partial [Pseudomonas sp.]|uniref:hypothetical protein n=1 Tax=Pseudomonas sp. TaxID=306 RepID=UPI003F98D3E5
RLMQLSFSLDLVVCALLIQEVTLVASTPASVSADDKTAIFNAFFRSFSVPYFDSADAISVTSLKAALKSFSTRNAT